MKNLIKSYTHCTNFFYPHSFWSHFFLYCSNISYKFNEKKKQHEINCAPTHNNTYINTHQCDTFMEIGLNAIDCRLYMCVYVFMNACKSIRYTK